jgi:uncharacterized repeat protein (TIGR03803 family)
MLAAFCVATTIASSAQTFTSLANFNKTDGGNASFGPLVQGANGNLYGTTQHGGVSSHCGQSYGCGVVFEVTPAGKVTPLYSFCAQAGCSDGGNPHAGLLLASNGKFYGTTSMGGSKNKGTVFELTPAGKLTTLYSFCSQAQCADGYNPGRLVQAANGNIYGITSNGGANLGGDGDAGGTVFKISPAGVLTTVYSFCAQVAGNGNCSDGQYPQAGLVQGSNGNFYGLTFWGGASTQCMGGCGAAFEITATGKLTTLYSFCSQSSSCPDGKQPEGALIQATDGNFYGTAFGGGANAGGTVFGITPAGALTTIYNFCSQVNGSHVCTDGAFPLSQLAQATDGNFYGTTWGGGANNDGSAFTVTPAGVFTQLYSFCSRTSCTDGSLPNAALTQASNGALYGLTNNGGTDSAGCFNTSGCGTVYRLSMGLDPFVEALPNASKAGRMVGILGNNLSGATSVTFNGTPATFTIVSRTLIRAAVPNGATSGTIQVTTHEGTLLSNVAFQVLP